MTDETGAVDTDALEFDDIAPGDPTAPGYSVREGIQTYAIGFVLAALLTAASFYVVRTPLIWGPGIPFALVVLAIAQMGVHLVFFLHMTTDPDNTNNALALAFGVLIVGLVIVGSLWIMYHLDTRLMPAGEMQQHMMQMQR
jgi:cytochrome o ubiquinol oxidase operon protein cyoD